MVKVCSLIYCINELLKSRNFVYLIILLFYHIKHSRMFDCSIKVFAMYNVVDTFQLMIRYCLTVLLEYIYIIDNMVYSYIIIQ